MSSPLDGRIRALAREEAEQAVRAAGVLDTTAPDTRGLQEQITDLHEHLHVAVTAIKRLEARLDVLEKTQYPNEQARTTSRRSAVRKESGDKHPE
jgi:hypothetical protein